MIWFLLLSVIAEKKHRKIFLLGQYPTDGKTHVQDSAFLSIKTNGDGGAIHHTATTLLSVLRCSFFEMSAMRFGGSIYKTFGDFECNSSCITDSHIISSSGSGHAVFAQYPDIVLDKTSVCESSKKSKRGHSVHLQGDLMSVSYGNFTNTKISSNSILYFAGSGKQVTVTQCTFRNNTAKHCICTFEVESVYMEYTRFSNNTNSLMFCGDKISGRMCYFYGNEVESNIFVNVRIYESFCDRRAPGLWFMAEEITPKATPIGQGECLFEVDPDQPGTDDKYARVMIFPPRSIAKQKMAYKIKMPIKN